MAKTGFSNGFADVPTKKYYKYHGWEKSCNTEPVLPPYLHFPSERIPLCTIYSEVDHDVSYIQGSPWNFGPYLSVWNQVNAAGGEDRLPILGQVRMTHDGEPTDWFRIWRAFLWFDTSIIPEGFEIHYAKIFIKYRAELDYYSNDYSLVIQRGIHLDGDGNPIVHHHPWDNADYDRTKVFSYGGSVRASSFVVGEYFCIELDSVGIGWINKGPGAVSKFCIRTDEDIVGRIPTWRVNKFLAIYLSDVLVSNDDRPKIVIG